MREDIEKITQRGPVTSSYRGLGTGEEIWYLLTSDNHLDSIYCDRDLMSEHFSEAVKKKARILIFGDFFDAMQGRHDPRRDYDELRPEFRVSNYFDVAVREAGKYLAPYANNIELISDGNHELTVLKNNNVNLIDRLIYDLGLRTGKQIIHGGYGGWYRLMLSLGGEVKTTKKSIKLKYFHGSGGEAPVTRGAIQTNRQAVYLPDADIVANGHSHNQYHIAINRERLSDKGVMHFDLQHHVRIPGYKQSYGDGATGWDVTRGGVPKPVGSMWVRVRYERKKVLVTVIPEIEPGTPVTIENKTIYTGKVYNQDTEGV